jgi:hypothetical protein
MKMKDIFEYLRLSQTFQYQNSSITSLSLRLTLETPKINLENQIHLQNVFKLNTRVHFK